MQVYAIPDMDENIWPVRVDWEENSEVQRTRIAGPFYERNIQEDETFIALRPFTLRREYHSDPTTQYSESFLYPLYKYTQYEGHSFRTIFQLIRWKSIDNDTSETIGTNEAESYLRAFEVFPFYFDYEYANPDYSYQGLFPIYGTVRNRLFVDQIDWRLFPLYAKVQDDDETAKYYIWPFFKDLEGPKSKGFGIWPLYGNFSRENDYHHQYLLWPFIYHNQNHLDRDIPQTKIGILPLYHEETREGYKQKDILWPFFGYTYSNNPSYDESRFLWPFIIQRRGQDRYLNQYAPFYSHSIKNGTESYWYLWPIYNSREYETEGVLVKRWKLLYFLYWHMNQYEAAQPDNKIAQKSHFWPLYSYRSETDKVTQFQLLSPLEPLFQNNEEIRKLYSPLLALYRYQHIHEESKDVEFLFSLINYERRTSHKRFNIGPLFDYKSGDAVKKVDFLKGLFRYERFNDRKETTFLWIRFTKDEKED